MKQIFAEIIAFFFIGLIFNLFVFILEKITGKKLDELLPDKSEKDDN